MNFSSCSVTYGKQDIDYKVMFAARKTLEIAVQPDFNVLVKAPHGTSFEEIKKRVAKRAGWIKRQLNYFQQFHPRTPTRRYVGGETHYYLGRRYRLKICRGNETGVKLARGYFHVVAPEDANSEKIKAIMDIWYARKAVEKYKESFDRYWPCFEKYAPSRPNLKVRRMKKRWGSLSKGGILTINAELIRAPIECIDYVIIHELCHLKFHDHSSAFFTFLETVLPDWEKRKHKLELALV
ncbi:MAG: M48 family metallopeptidase [Deltaproteobacteria bacterium]|nr:M48 family metallopeptidase [Deltaproteobacteria bacterium]